MSQRESDRARRRDSAAGNGNGMDRRLKRRREGERDGLECARCVDYTVILHLTNQRRDFPIQRSTDAELFHEDMGEGV